MGSHVPFPSELVHSLQHDPVEQNWADWGSRPSSAGSCVEQTEDLIPSPQASGMVQMVTLVHRGCDVGRRLLLYGSAFYHRRISTE